jgi:hypothetical protein
MKPKKVFRARDIQIKRGLIKSKLKKINLGNHKQGVRSNDSTPNKSHKINPSMYFILMFLEAGNVGKINFDKRQDRRQVSNQPKEGNLSTMNVPRLPYDSSVDPLQTSKSPTRFRNNNFKSPPGRNVNNSFRTIKPSHPDMGSIDMALPMTSIN